MKNATKTAIEDAIVAWVDANRAGGIRLLQELVQTPSYSGKEGRGDDPTTVAGRVFKAASEHGSRVETQVVRSESENVIEIIDGPGKRAVVLEAHTDTVPEGDPRLWHEGKPFSGAEGFVEYLGDRRVAVEIDGGRYEAGIRDRMARIWELRRQKRLPIVYGRGSFDNKGPVVSTVLAMGALADALRATDGRLAGSVIAAYSVDEETSATGIKSFACGTDSWLARQGFLSGPVDGEGFLRDINGIAMDGSYGWVPIVGHRGSVQFELRTRGRSAHASTPHLGASATELMAILLLHLRKSEERMREQLLAFLEQSLLGPPTFAIGTTLIGGGIQAVAMTAEGPRVERTGVNAVPNWCQATIDVRFPPSYELSLADTVDSISRVIDAALREVPLVDGWSWELITLGCDPPVALARSFEDAAALPLVKVARNRAAQILGFEPHLETAPGGTDATFMIHEGRIPTLVEFGPAGALSHDNHEYVEVDSVIDGAKILALTTLDLLGLAD
jgi:succinyl-diaminopimelate desuccinylase